MTLGFRGSTLSLATVLLLAAATTSSLSSAAAVKQSSHQTSIGKQVVGYHQVSNQRASALENRGAALIINRADQMDAVPSVPIGWNSPAMLVYAVSYRNEDGSLMDVQVPNPRSQADILNC